MAMGWRTLFSPQLLTGGVAGGVAAFLTLIYCFSFAALIYAGPLASYIPIGFNSALLSSIVMALVTALHSSFRFATAGPDGATAALLATLAGSILNSLSASLPEKQLFSTVWLGLTLATFMTGGMLWILGQLRLGKLIRFIPYPVIGGFLAGTGWLLLRGAFRVMTNRSLSWQPWPSLWWIVETDVLRLWLPGLLLALLILVVVGRYRKFWVLPALIGGSLALFYGLLPLLSLSILEARQMGLLFDAFTSVLPWQSVSLIDFASVEGMVLLAQLPILATLVIITATALLLNATGLEIISREDGDLDQELRVAGVGNLLSAVGGGWAGYLSLSRSLLMYQIGSRTPLATGISAAICLAAWFLGSSYLLYMPKFILGGLLAYLGLKLLHEWLIKSWLKLSRLDCFLILITLLTIIRFGLLQGVSIGILLSCIVFIYNYSKNPSIKYTLSGFAYHNSFKRSPSERNFLEQEHQQVYTLYLQGFIFFGTVKQIFDQVKERVLDDSLTALRFLILDFRLVNGLDSSAILSFIRISQLANKYQFQILFSHTNYLVRKQLRTGITDPSNDFDAQPLLHFFPQIEIATDWVADQILEQSQFRRKRYIPLSIQLDDWFPNPLDSNELLPYLEKLSLGEGEILFGQGDPAEQLYFLESGLVKASILPEDGELRRVQELGAGALLGEFGFYSQRPYDATVITDRPSIFYALSRENLQRMEQDNPRLALAFQQLVIHWLTLRLSHADHEINALVL